MIAASFLRPKIPGERGISTSGRRDDNLPCSAQNYCDIEGDRPVFEIHHVRLKPGLDILECISFTLEPANLCEAGDAGLYKCAQVVAGHDAGELLIVFQEVRAGTYDAHLSAEHIQELGKLIQPELAHPMRRGKYAGIILCGLPFQVRIPICIVRNLMIVNSRF